MELNHIAGFLENSQETAVSFPYESGDSSAVSLKISRAIALLKNKQNGQ
ncbi:hypothetical protein QUB56_31025 [Microcoleus sp. AR_TQ3_B6]